MEQNRRFRSEWGQLLGLGLFTVGMLFLGVGYWRGSSARFDVERLSHLISGILGGLVLVAIGVTLRICASQVAEARQLDRVEQALRTEARRRSLAEPEIELPRERGGTAANDNDQTHSPLTAGDPFEARDHSSDGHSIWLTETSASSSRNARQGEGL